MAETQPFDREVSRRDLRNVAAEFDPFMRAIRHRRLTIQERMLRSHRAWMSQPFLREYNPDLEYNAPGPYAIPFARRAIERMVIRSAKIVLPKTKWFEVQSFAGTLETGPQAEAVDSYMRFLFTKHISTKLVVSQLIRCLYLYNFAGLRTSPVIRNGKVWPFWRAIDPFMLYPFPETATCFEDCSLLFEDIFMPKQRYDTLVGKGIALPIENRELGSPHWPSHLVERLAHQGLSDPSNVGVTTEEQVRTARASLDATPQNQFVALSEAWVERNGALYSLWLAWNVGDGEAARVVRFKRSDYPYPLIRWASIRTVPNELFTTAYMEDVQETSALANSQLAQTEHARRIATNPPVGFNIGQGQGRTDKLIYKPGAKWEFADDPREMFKSLDLPDTSPSGLRAAQWSIGIINSIMGSGGIVEGQPGRNMPRAGFAVNNLLNLGLAEVQDVSETTEGQLLTPGMGDIYKITELFLPKDQLVSIPSTGTSQAIEERVESFLGHFEFEWIGSQQAQDNQQRAQTLLTFVNLLSTLVPAINAQGQQVNWAELLHMIWRDGLGERGFSSVISPVPGGQPNPLISETPNGQNGQSGGTLSSSILNNLTSPGRI